MYTLQGIICGERLARPAGLEAVALHQGLVLYPFVDRVLEELSIPFLPFSYSEDLSNLERLLGSSPMNGVLLYVEAEFFGGLGGQLSWRWESGRPVEAPVRDPYAINIALARMGVVVGPHHDEFDALDLGRYRETNDWLKGGV